MKKNAWLLLLMVVVVSACSLLNKQALPASSNDDQGYAYSLPERPYKGTKTKEFSLIHTDLKLVPIWEKQEMKGEAILTLHPHFYAKKKLTLDAKWMQVHAVALLDTADNKKNLGFKADSTSLKIKLDKKYTRTDTIRVWVKYTAKPNSIKDSSKTTIGRRKGLYFINPLGVDKVKPQQIWTQGEPVSNSVWFPTIDDPNQKMTQRLAVTVDAKFKTLSNGLLVSQELEANGTRTDVWEQKLPHAPYLTALVVGEYTIVKDKWRNIELGYWVEPKDSASAKVVFGNTPEMLEFFSNKFGVDFPWEKYDQVVVRNFIAGAMENTSAVVFNKSNMRSKQEAMDWHREDVVAHELAHHWFGDLVTSESWANLVLNEGFANYCEYLWYEHKYGKDSADFHLYQSRASYYESFPRRPVIYPYYEVEDDMFDAHSYDKGGMILHMLRKKIGDDAFFTSIRNYLKANAYKTAELSDLKKAFEATSGLDLTQFFQQWFYAPGHPILNIKTEVKSDSLLVTVEQVQKEHEAFKFELPTYLYEGGKPRIENLNVTKRKETFLLTVDAKPLGISFNDERTLLAECNYAQSAKEWLSVYEACPSIDCKLAVIRSNYLTKDTSDATIEVLDKALKDKFPVIRNAGMLYFSKTPQGRTEEHIETLSNIAKKDKATSCRFHAIDKLSGTFPKDSSLIPIYKRALKDSSIRVQMGGLMALKKVAREDALLRAGSFETSTNQDVIYTLSKIYKDVKDESKMGFFKHALYNTESGHRRAVLENYRIYLTTKASRLVRKGAKVLKKVYEGENDSKARQDIGSTLWDLVQESNIRLKDIEKDVHDNKNATKGKPYEQKMLLEKYEDVKAENNKLKKIALEVLKMEKNPDVLRYYRNIGLADLKLDKVKPKVGDAK